MPESIKDWYLETDDFGWLGATSASSSFLVRTVPKSGGSTVVILMHEHLGGKLLMGFAWMNRNLQHKRVYIKAILNKKKL